MPTRLADVAARAGVSPATVSRVLNDVTTVDRQLAARVRTVVADLGYEPNRLARNLRRQRADMIGVLISDIQNPHFAELVHGIEQAAFRAGYRVLLCNTDEKPDRQTAHLRTLAQERVAGIILSPTSDEGTSLEEIIRAATPVVAVDRPVHLGGADAVVANNARGAALATDLLVRAGHRAIGFIAGPTAVGTAVERRRGYLHALEGAGIEPVVEEADYRAEGGRQAMERLLARHPRITAAIISNNLMTAGALATLAAQHVAVPDRLALITFDDPFWASLVAPPLTVLAQPVAQMAERAVALLVERIEHRRTTATTERFDLELRVRRSCGTAAVTPGG